MKRMIKSEQTSQVLSFVLEKIQVVCYRVTLSRSLQCHNAESRDVHFLLRCYVKTSSK